MSFRSIFQTGAFRDVDGVAAALARTPTVQQDTSLSSLCLTADLHLLLDGERLALTGDALGSLLRDHLALEGASGRSWRRKLAGAFARSMNWPEVPGWPGSVYFAEAGEEYGPQWVLSRLAETPPDRITWPAEHLSEIDSLNRRLQASDRPILIRRVQNTVIAVRSPAYAPLDHREVVEALRAFGMNRLAWVSMTRRTLDLAVYLDLPAFDLGGDPYHAGLHILNSETGNGRLIINGYLFRWACSNGTIFGVRHRRNFADAVHIGDRERLVARLQESLGSTLRHLENVGALLARIRHQAITPAACAYLLREVRRAAGPVAARFIQEQFGAGPLPAYEVYNAVTQLAQRYRGERRRALERLGGRLVERLARRIPA